MLWCCWVIYRLGELQVKRHVNNVVSLRYYQPRQLFQLWNLPSQQLVTDLMLSRLDYCNSVVTDLPMSTIAPQQRVTTLRRVSFSVLTIGLTLHQLYANFIGFLMIHHSINAGHHTSIVRLASSLHSTHANYTGTPCIFCFWAVRLEQSAGWITSDWLASALPTPQVIVVPLSFDWTNWQFKGGALNLQNRKMTDKEISWGGNCRTGK